MNKDILNKANIDYDEGVRRMMGDAEFFEQMLAMFLDDRSIPEGRTALKNNDMKALFEASHGLKGVSGNLSITDLFAAASKVVDKIRANDTTDMEAAFDAMEFEWNRAYNAIKTAITEEP